MRYGVWMQTFPLPVKHNPTDEFSSPTRIIQFGDGYSERSANGLNRPIEVWSVECAFASPIAGASLQDFLEEHGGWKAFLWQSPRDSTPGTYIIVQPVSGTTRRGGGSKPYFFTRSMKFKRVYLPPVPVLNPAVNPVSTTFIQISSGVS